MARFRDTLLGLVNRLADAHDEFDGPDELTPGWQLLKRLPPVNPKGERAAASSVEGFIKLALKHMAEYSLVRLERDSEDDSQSVYTATHRLRIQLRELTMPKLFDLARVSAPA